MESNYSSRFSGEQVDAAVEYYLRHSQTVQSSDYEYPVTVFCNSSTGFPTKPFSKLPEDKPETFPFKGSDGNLWYEVPNSSDKTWYQCALMINYKSQRVVSQGSVLDMRGQDGSKGDKGDKGDDGDKGDKGDKGDDGNDGNDGASFTNNLVKGTKDWSSFLTQEGWEIEETPRENDGLYIATGHNTFDKNYIDLYNNRNLEFEPDTIYTLSVDLKGSGKIRSFIYPNVTAKIIATHSCNIPNSTADDTHINHTLTENWDRHYIVFRTLPEISGLKNIVLRIQDTTSTASACGLKIEKGDNRNPQWSAHPEEYKGANGNYVEYRFKRSSQYAVSLTSSQKASRNPSGWYTDINEDMESFDIVKVNTASAFDRYLIRNYSSISESNTSSQAYTYFNLSSTASYADIASRFKSLHSTDLIANATQQTVIVEAFKEYKSLHTLCNSREDLVGVNTEYHRLYTKYINEDHFWVLFMIYATINGEDDSLIGEWSSPQRLQGVDGKPGPSGNPGISGIPGVSMGVAFTLGTADSIMPSAVNPKQSPYNTNYNALFASGTGWSKETPAITDTYPYIWFTQCRYKVEKNSNNIDVYTFEDSWSTPARYTGLNGITKEEITYTRSPVIYPMGIYTPGLTYTNDGNKTPYVYVPEDNNYYVLTGQGNWTGTTSLTPASSSIWWTKMEGFEALFTKIGIISNGLIGMAVFNEEYMFSQKGLNPNNEEISTYEKFRISTNGDILDDPYAKTAQFRPLFCVNFKTGDFYSISVDNSIAQARSEIVQEANSISLHVQDIIEGKLRTAGINIASGEVTVTGKFKGTMDGTFNGDVSAKSLTVLGEDNTPVLSFTTYKKSLGVFNGETLDEGTPVMVVSFKDKKYIVNMSELTQPTGDNSPHYIKVAPVFSTLATTTSVSLQMGIQKTKEYVCLTEVPYMAIDNGDGTPSNVVKTAKLYASDGTTELDWSKYLNIYYENSDFLQEVESNTGTGVYTFKLKSGASPAKATNIYKATPLATMVTLIITTIGSSNNTGFITGSSGDFIESDTPRVYIHAPSEASAYEQFSIKDGAVPIFSSAYVVVARSLVMQGGVATATGTLGYLNITGGSITAHANTAKGVTTTSTYFGDISTSPKVITGQELSYNTSISKVVLSPDLPLIQ